MVITQAEYETRWQNVQKSCEERQLEGVLVWSRGGGAVDSFADVLYLSNQYSPFPMTAALPPHWVGRAHSAVFVPRQGEPTLIVDHPDWRRDLVAVEDVRFGLDLPAVALDVLRERNCASGRVGLVGGDAMVGTVQRALLEQAGSIEFVHVDSLVEELRAHKSERELDLLRAAAELGDEVVRRIIERALVPGTTEAEAVAAGYSYAMSQGAAFYDACVASGPNSDYYAYGRLPSWTTRSLEAGDIFHIDTYAALDGYLYDFARCCVSGGNASDGQIEVMEAAIDSVHAGVAAVRPGVASSELFKAVNGVLVERGMMPDESGDGAPTSALTVSFPAHGHSYGMYWERPWFTADNDVPIAEGMCIGIEAMAGRPGVGSAKFEQDVIVTAEGAELITKSETHYW